jgi:soluble lytic murein transglycosylase-like protein
MQQLQTLIAQVERGPAGFAAALDAAQADSASTQATSAGVGESAASGSTATAAAYTPSTAALYGAGSTADAADTTLGQSTTASTVGYPSASVENAAASATVPVSSSTTAAGGAGSAYVPLIEQAAARNGVDPAVLYGLIEQESGFDPNATSRAGALGLTQLMPGTASSLGVSEPLNAAQSIEGGARYLGQLLRQFSGNTTDALAAYNAGPGAVQQYGGVPPYPETQQYVSKVLANAANYSSTASSGATGTIA